MAQNSPSTVSSAITMVSVGPAKRSIPTRPKSWRLASATKALPGTDKHVHGLDRFGADGHSAHGLDTAKYIDLMRRRPNAWRRSRRGWAYPCQGGVHATMRGTPATFAVATDIWAEATIGNFRTWHIAAHRLHGDVLVPKDDAREVSPPRYRASTVALRLGEVSAPVPART